MCGCGSCGGGGKTKQGEVLRGSSHLPRGNKCPTKEFNIDYLRERIMDVRNPETSSQL